MKVVQMLLAAAATTMSMASPAIAETPVAVVSSVVVRQASVEDPGHPAIPVVIWTPASGDRLPLVIISHGTGAAPLSHIDTAQALANAGFVAVAPMHPGDNFQDDSAVGKTAWFVDRSRHISKVIDFMLTKWEGHVRLAPREISIFGFSAGATTALISIGGVPDLARAADHCLKTPEFVCKILVPQSSSDKPQWTNDPRIVAAVIAAPGIGFAFEPKGLARVHAPVQLWSGSADDTVPFDTNTAIVRRLLPRAPESHTVESAVHLSFLAPCTPQTPPFLCQDKSGFDRAAFHKQFNESIVKFFETHLRSK